MSDNTITVETVRNILEAVTLVADVKNLSQAVCFNLGVQGDKAGAVVRRFEKSRSVLNEELRKVESELREQFKTASPLDQKDLADKMSAARVNFEAAVYELLEQEVTDFTPKKFKLSDFAAKEEIRSEKEVIKKGDSLVTIRFYQLMNKFIEE